MCICQLQFLTTSVNHLFLPQHLFALEQRDELCKAVAEAGAAYVGVSVRVRKEPTTFEQFQAHRLGKYRSVQFFFSLTVIRQIYVKKRLDINIFYCELGM